MDAEGPRGDLILGPPSGKWGWVVVRAVETPDHWGLQCHLLPAV